MQPAAEVPRKRLFGARAFAAAAVLVALVGILLWRAARPAVRPASPRPKLARLTWDSGLTFQPALSPDGKRVAFASDRAGQGNLDIWIQEREGTNPVQLTRDPADEVTPAFSPDARELVFRSDRDGGGIYRLPTGGGPATLLAKGGRNPRYSPDGRRIAYWSGPWKGGRLFVVQAGNGGARPVETGVEGAMHPIWSPDGRHLLFLAQQDWWVVPAEGGKAVRTGAHDLLAQHGWPSDWPGIVPEAWTAGNWIVFSARVGDISNLWRVSLLPGNWQVRGTPEQLSFGTGTECQASAAGSRLAFASIAHKADLWSFPVDDGRVRGEPDRLTRDAAVKLYPHLSADGRWMVYRSDRLGNNDIWIKDLKTGVEFPLAATPLHESNPIISRDGSQVAYYAAEKDRWPMYRVSVSGGAPERVCADCGAPSDWSPDGNYILHTRFPETAAISLFEVRSRWQMRLLERPGLLVTSGRFSADGRWIASRNLTNTSAG